MYKTLSLTSASAFAHVLSTSVPAYAGDGARATSESTVVGNTAIDGGSLRDNLTKNSWNGGATGIVHDQQNNGNNNARGLAIAAVADGINFGFNGPPV